MTALMTFKQVAFRYPSAKQNVMESLDLDIPEGEITAILGPNGAGKTTLLQLALGWLRLEKGELVLDGKPLVAYSRREMGQMMALVPQSEHMAFDFSVVDYVLLGRAPYLDPLALPGEADVQAARNALEKVGITHLSSRSVTALSGGERQLLLIARALAQQPRLLLLDEPTSHLDLGNKGRVARLLRQLNGQGVTVLFTTHEADVAAALADKLILMRHGEVLDFGSLDESLTSEKLSELYGLPVKVARVDGHPVVLWS